jgi:integrase
MSESLLRLLNNQACSFHDLRHTYASLMAEAGASPKYVQEQLRHASIQVTMHISSHLFPSGNCKWVKRLEDTLSKGNPYPRCTYLKFVAAVDAA